MTQRTWDGKHIEVWKGRLPGTFDLEEREVELAGFDDVVVCAVVARVKGARPVVNRKGEIECTVEFQSIDMRIAEGALRQEIIEQLGLYGADTLFGEIHVPPPVASPSAPTPPDGIDPETGEIDVADDEAPEPAQRIEPEPRPGAKPEPASSTGPKVAKFTADDGGPDEREVVGPVRGERKDKALERFLQEA